MHAYTDAVTKTISLSDDAYEALVAVKRPDESFSELARRLAQLERRKALFDPNLKSPWTPDEVEALIAKVYAERDKSIEPRYKVPDAVR